ncbi:MAG: CopG family ribbon-helix-helix protein [Gammaproteobacteria bacterium]|nr:CopG family ribbon-helix-helix protein [Gammaproteobacteria bacterium]MCF6364113.1 CopG family ribbon-helix-helix protein [Gammaproteobacteria bacterium]
MSVTSVRLQPDIEKPLEILSKKLDRSRNYLINQAIREFLDRRSVSEERWSDTLEALDSAKKGAVADEAEVVEWLKGWGSDNEKPAPKI